jgi:hypothetical protein
VYLEGTLIDNSNVSSNIIGGTLEHPHHCSVYEPAHYNSICWCGSGKWFFSNMFSQFAEVGENRNKALNLLEKSVINMI